MPASERKRHESGSGSQPPRFAGLAVWCIWIACNRSSERITGHFHEKAGPCQAFFLVVPFVQPTADQREALLAFSLSFIERFLFGHRDSRSPTSGGAQCCHPEFSNHRLALLPSALFVELLLRCQLGVLNWKRVLPSRSRTECLCFQRRRSWPVPQSPELGDLTKPCQAATFFCCCRKL